MDGRMPWDRLGTPCGRMPGQDHFVPNPRGNQRPHAVDRKFLARGYALRMPSQPYRITVVCLGNICRSPIGEVVLRDRVEQAGLGGRVAVDSAGTGDWHIGHGADDRAVATLLDAGYAIDHVARQITHDWFDRIDLALAMDVSNYENLAALMQRADAATELRMFRAFDPALAGAPEPSDELTVPDPYYGGGEDFLAVLAMVERAADGLVAQLPARL